MICKNCGKTLIRGYAFCMECGTPVPAEKEEDSKAPSSQNGMTENTGAPDKEGTLVFCPNCGMQIQKNPNRCEKCGMALSNSLHNGAASNVPLFNTEDSASGGLSDFAGLSDEEISKIESLGGNNNMFAAPPTAEDINTLTAQLAGFSAANGDIMPSIESIDAPKQPNKIRQKEPERGKAHEMENFSMSEADAAYEDMSLSGEKVPVIEGCSMDEDVSKDVDLDPYKYLAASMDDMSASLDMQEPAKSEATAKPEANNAPEPITPVIVPPVSSMESIAPVERSHDTEKAHEAAPVSSMESIAPVEKSHDSEKVHEAAPVSSMESIAPVEKSHDSEKAHEAAPVSSMESIAPVEKSHDSEKAHEAAPVSSMESIAPVEKTHDSEKAHEAAPVSSMESIAPVEKSHDFEKAHEAAPVSSMESIAPVEKSHDSEKAHETVPSVSSMESIAPVEKTKDESEKAPEAVTPVIVPSVAAVTSTESVSDKPKNETDKIPEPVTPIIEPITVPENSSSTEKAKPEEKSEDEKLPQSKETANAPVSITPIPPITLDTDVTKPTEAIAPISASVSPEAPAPEAKKPVRVAEMPPKKEKPKPEPEDFIPEEIGFISESGTAVREETKKPESKSGAAPTAVLAPPAPSNNNTQTAKPNGDPVIPPLRPEGEAPKGNLVYCKNCGQDMYDTETVCKKCGAPYKGGYSVPSPEAKEKKSGKLFGFLPIPAAIGTAAALVVVVALVVILSSRSSKPPIGPDIQTTSSDPAVSCTMNSDVSEPVESTASEPTVSSADETSSAPEESTPEQSSVQSSAASTAVQSSIKPQSSSNKPKSSSKPQSSSVPVTDQPSAKVQTLEADRLRIMDAAAQLSGEIGKIEVLVKHINYALEHSKYIPEKTLTDCYNEDLTKTFVQSINNNRVTMTILFDNARPANSELNSLYSMLSELKGKYNDCCNFIADPGDARKFTANAAVYINSFNSSLTQMGISKFYTAAYTNADKDRAYATALRASQTCISNSSTSFKNLLSALAKLGNSRFEVSADTALGKNANTYLEAAASYGRLNAYRLMLLGVTSSYSKNYTDISSAYNAFTGIIDYNLNITEHSLTDYTSQVSRSTTIAGNASTSISSAISKAF